MAGSRSPARTGIQRFRPAVGAYSGAEAGLGIRSGLKAVRLAGKGGDVYGAEEFARDTGVSRETLARLVHYESLLRRWQGAVNLVSARSLDDGWRRHFLDSAQLVPLIPAYDGPLYDVGSGAGFPGMVLALMGLPRVVLIESDGRKCVFLRQVARECNVPLSVENVRLAAKMVESPGLASAGVVVARGLASLNRTLHIVFPLLTDRTYCILAKGARVDDEVTAAQADWTMSIERFPSRSDPSGTILRLRGIRRVS